MTVKVNKHQCTSIYNNFMFSSLIGSQSGNLEFTPIGKRRPRQDRDAEVGKTDTTFDTTEDLTQKSGFSDSNTFKMAQPVKPQPPTLSLFNGFFSNKDNIVGDGTNSVQSLNGQIEKLQNENYNLKFEVATLTRYLRNTPEEQQNLVFENIELKKQQREDQKGGSDDDAFRAMKQLYKELLEQKEQEMRELQAENAKLANQLPVSRVPPDLYDRLEELQNDNQTLRRRLAQDTTSAAGSAATLQGENNDLRSELDRMERELGDKRHENAELSSQVQELQHKIADSQDKLAECARDLRQVEADRNDLQDRFKEKEQRMLQEIESLEALLRQSRSKAADSSYKDQLTAEMQRLKDNMRTSENEAEARLRAKDREISELQAKLHALERSLDHALGLSERLKRQISALEQELREKRDLDSLSREKSAYDSSSLVKLYEDQVRELRDKTTVMLEEKSALEADLFDLKSELNNITSKCNILEKENGDFQERFDFYEKEYAALAEEVEQKSNRILNLERLLLEPVFDRHDQRLERQVEVLEFQNKKLELEADEFRRRMEKMAAEKQQALADSFDQTSKIRDLQSMQSKLETKIRDKEEVIEALENRLRQNSTHNLRSRQFTEDPHMLKADFEYELRNAQREKDRLEKDLLRLQADLVDQQRYYENRLEDLKTQRKSETSASENAVVALLEGQLDEAQKEVKTLNLKQADYIRQIEKMKLNDRNEEYQEKLFALEERLRVAQKDKTRLQLVIDSLETDAKILMSEKSQQELKIRNLDEELTKTTRHCHKLAKKVNDLDVLEYKSVQGDEKMKKANLQLRAQVDQLNKKITSLKLAPPSPKSPRRPRSSDTRLLQNELLYFKAKLYETQVKLKDLMLVNSLVVASIKNADEVFKTELAKLAVVGVYPDYEERKKPLFRVLAKFVLAGVKIKNRAQRAKERNAQMLQLREDIERDRLR